MRAGGKINFLSQNGTQTFLGFNNIDKYLYTKMSNNQQTFFCKKKFGKKKQRSAEIIFSGSEGNYFWV